MSPSVERRERAGRPPARKCQAKKRNGDPCGSWAIQGGKVCNQHGGRLPTVKLNAKRTLALAKIREHFELADDVEPTDIILAAVQRAAQDMLVLEQAFHNDEHFRPAYERAVDRAARISKMAIDAGISERRTKVAETDATKMMSIMQAGLDAAGMTNDQIERARAAMAQKAEQYEKGSR